MDPRLLRLTFGNQFDVLIACENFIPNLRTMEISTQPQRQHMHDCLSGFPEYMIQTAYRQMDGMDGVNLRMVIWLTTWQLHIVHTTLLSTGGSDLGSYLDFAWSNLFATHLPGGAVASIAGSRVLR